jgi:Transcription termination factor nusG
LHYFVMNIERERCWLAAYTRSRHESHVADRLSVKGVESLLPTYERLSRWSDRVQRSQAPLFPGYLTNNPRFLWDIALQFSGLKRFEVRFDH